MKMTIFAWDPGLLLRVDIDLLSRQLYPEERSGPPSTKPKEVKDKVPSSIALS